MSAARFRKLALALPEVSAMPFGVHWNYKVRGKTFATQTNNHHNDGRIAVWLKAEPGVQDELVRADAERYFVPPYVGPSGWVGVRLDKKPDWGALAALTKSAWSLSAPAKLLAKPATRPPARRTSSSPSRSRT